MNAISISNVAIRQTENNLYNLNDLHKASGGEKRHELTNWLKLQQTNELIDELSKPENTGLKENQQVIKVVRGGNNRGTYACKELVYAYATWISAKFFLLVIRTFDAVVSGSQPKLAKTTVADRTPLRQAVSALVGKCNIDYSSAYNMVHQRFGVESIEEIAADKLPDAVAYIHALTLHSGLFGEVLDRLPETGAYVALSERELSNFATATYYLDWATRQLYDLSEPLKRLGARDKGVAAYTLRMESHSWLKHCRETLQRVQPEMRDAYFREHVAGSLRRMDALMRG